ncbi:MAG: putative entry exclusion protein TrbK-alt [Sphingomonadaceae bacterium]|nr:putative entry exclusion protein TrbK-alt [Sphingomonadaceae bacterium]
MLSRSARYAALDRRGRRRTALALGLAAALVAGMAFMAVKEAETPGGDEPRPVALRPVDPLTAEFARCQALGEAGARDPQCLAAWAENRRRFLTPDHRVLGPNPAATPARER